MAASREMSMVVVVAAMLVAMAISTWVSAVEAQSDTSCIQSLLPCANYLNSTSPPATCCGPLKEALRTQLKCLCGVFQNPGFAGAASVNFTQVLELPKHCGITNVDPTSMCATVEQGPASAPMAPGASSGGSTPAEQGTNAASSKGPVSSLVLLLVAFIFY